MLLLNPLKNIPVLYAWIKQTIYERNYSLVLSQFYAFNLCIICISIIPNKENWTYDMYKLLRCKAQDSSSILNYNKIQINIRQKTNTNVHGSPYSWGYVHQPFIMYYSFNKRKITFSTTPCCHTYLHPYSGSPKYNTLSTYWFNSTQH